MFASKDLFLASSGGYQISRSVRLRSSATAYFNRTPASATNRQIMTFSMWVKLGATTGGTGYLFSANTAAGFNDAFGMSFSSGILVLSGTSGGATVFDLETTQVFRDPSAWYHIVYAIDTTQATAANRIKLYINGVQVTAFGIATYPPQNTNIQMNNNVATYIGRLGYTSSALFDGYLTEINFIDGQALTPSSFGQNDPVTGVWQPKKYLGTYGTNGFYLNFNDNSAATAAAIGKDSSGNGNNWTPNNISVTAGVTYDSMLDVPTLWADGGNGRGNYAVLNPLFKQDGSTNTVYGSMGTPSQANLQAILSAGQNVYGSISTSANAGKWYAEFTASSITSDCWFGFMSSDGNLNRSAYISATSGVVVENSSKSTAGFAANDVIGVALDTVAFTIQFYKNGSAIGSSYAISSAIYTQYFWCYTNSGATVYFNFGQRPFTYTPPTGFFALNTQNLPTPTISNGANYMAATTYTGNGGTQSIVNSGNNAGAISFQPDFIWVKYRNQAYNNDLFDSIRGISKYIRSNTTQAELTYSGFGVTAFNSNGFSVTDDSVGSYEVNGSGGSLIAWQWQAGKGSTSSNTSGTITSTVSVGATQGFSVVTFTSSVNAVGTVGHGLGVAPKMIITKCRSSTDTWYTYHTSLGATAGISLQTTGAAVTSGNYWNNTAPSSTVFTINATTSGVFYSSSQTYVAYCFSEIPGYSKFGSYTGNGSADGTFVYLGFRPRFIMIKPSSTIGFWSILDSSRDSYNVALDVLKPNASDAESTNQAQIDFLSNGFKLHGTYGYTNDIGVTYIYMAVAENPYKLSLAR